jgi:hypothetical protein
MPPRPSPSAPPVTPLDEATVIGWLEKLRVELWMRDAELRAEQQARHEELLAEVRALRELQQPRRRLSRSALLTVIAAAVDDRAFCASEILDHATVDADLRHTLTLARIQEAKQLGRILARVEERPIKGWRLEHLGVERDGVVCGCGKTDPHRPAMRGLSASHCNAACERSIRAVGRHVLVCPIG